MLTLKQKYQEGGTSPQPYDPYMFEVYYYDFNDENQKIRLTSEMQQIITDKTPHTYDNTKTGRFIIRPIHQMNQHSEQMFLSFLYDSTPTTVNKPIPPKVNLEPIFEDPEVSKSKTNANELARQLEQLEEQVTIKVDNTGVSNIYRALAIKNYLKDNTETDPNINTEGTYYKIVSKEEQETIIEISLPLPRLLLAIDLFFNLNNLSFGRRIELLMNYLKNKKKKTETMSENIEKIIEKIERIEQNKTMLFNVIVNQKFKEQINLYFKDVDSTDQFNIDFSTIMNDFEKIIDDAQEMSKLYATRIIKMNEESESKSEINIESLLQEIQQKTEEYLIFYNKIKAIMDNDKLLPEITVKNKIAEKLTQPTYDEYSKKEKNIADLLKSLNRVDISAYDYSTAKEIYKIVEMYYDIIKNASRNLDTYYKYANP